MNKDATSQEKNRNLSVSPYSPEPLQKIAGPFWREFRVLMASKLYSSGKMSSNRAARMAGVGHVEFLLIIVLFDEPLARRAIKSMGLAFWSPLRLIFEAKKNGIVQTISPVIDNFFKAGIWLEEDICRRILILASENVS